jgi:hypothetical protein
MRVLFITTYTALHVSAYMQAIIRCYPDNITKVKLLIFSVNPLSHDILLQLSCVCIAKIQYNILMLDKVVEIVIGCERRYFIELLLYYAQQDAKPEHKVTKLVSTIFFFI